MSSCSLLSRLVHRGVVSGCGGGRHRHMLEATTIMTVVPATTNHYYFSTYADDKLAAKELRRQQFEQRLARVEHLKTRRDGRPTEVKKTEFKTWYDKRRTYHEIMDRKARQEGLPWKIQVAAVVERLPLILPVREKWEQDYVDLRKHLNQFTWDYPNELARLDKKVEESEDIDGVTVNVEPEVEVFPRETEADATGDISTMNRQLADRIFFAQKETRQSLWGFPTCDVGDGETLQAAALRLAEETLGKDCQVLALSNCPIAVELHVDKKDGTYGTKTFFMRLQYYKGDVQPVTNVAQYGWLSRTELSKKAKAKEGINAAKFFHYML